MNESPNSGFGPNDVDRVIDQYGKPLRTEHRKALTDRLRDERKRYESIQKERGQTKERGQGDRGR